MSTTPDDVTSSTTAADFTRRLGDLRAAGEPVPMRHIFALAKEFTAMHPAQIEALLEASDHESRVGAVSIMDFEARSRRTPASRREELFRLYVRRHDQINTWDLVDRAAPSVVGGYLFDKPRDQLYVYARSTDWWERRTAIVATWFFIRQGDLDDTFAIADLLAHDPEDLVQKAVGGWVREAGKRDPARLVEFLDRHASTMPRTALRYAIEHLDPEAPPALSPVALIPRWPGGGDPADAMGDKSGTPFAANAASGEPNAPVSRHHGVKAP
jgi:3-methyladenine DNA glycosylase AlkD